MANEFRNDFGVGIQFGNLTKTPELKQSNNGQGVYAYVTVAVNSGYYTDANGQQQQRTEFWNFLANDATARAACTLQKGARVWVQYHVNVTPGQKQQDGSYSAERITLRMSGIAQQVFAPQAQAAPVAPAQQPMQPAAQYQQPVAQPATQGPVWTPEATPDFSANFSGNLPFGG